MFIILKEIRKKSVETFKIKDLRKHKIPVA